MKWLARARRPAPPPLQMRSLARTHIGNVRTINEDRVLDCPDHRLWAVADGMGGHSRGDRAATIVIRALAAIAEGDSPLACEKIQAAIMAANDQILALCEPNEICGSTVAGLHVARNDCILFWAGDSRIYRHRGGSLRLLSRDHSYVQRLLDDDLITPEEAKRHPQANIITRAVGISPSLDIDFSVDDIREGDRFLLCSDGLSAMVEDDQICRMMDKDMTVASNELLAAALKAGGTDNISFILVEASVES